jgi:hypothetical protein
VNGKADAAVNGKRFEMRCAQANVLRDIDFGVVRLYGTGFQPYTNRP